MSFPDDVYKAVQRVPGGRVATYGQISILAGRGRAARVVGAVLARNPYGQGVPWHRILKASGELAAGGHTQLQAKLLQDEGVVVVDGKVDLRKYQWDSSI